MIDHDALAATGRRLAHPLERALGANPDSDLLSIIHEFGVPSSWAYCCAAFDKKKEFKEVLGKLALTLVDAIEAKLVEPNILRDLAVTLLNLNHAFRSSWKLERTLQVISIAREAHPDIFDTQFRRLIVLAALRSESKALFEASGHPLNSIKPDSETLFALCEGRGGLLDDVFPPISTWAKAAQDDLVSMFVQAVILGKPANDTQEEFLGMLHDRGIGGRAWITLESMKSAAVRNTIISKKIQLDAEDVAGIPHAQRLKFCMAGLISAFDAKVKDSSLDEKLAEDLGL